MTTRASGSFQVKLSPQAPDLPSDTSAPGRMHIDKQFQGDLQATSHGQMLALQGGVAGSAGYVAMEVVTGSLLGRAGSFALQHSGIMNRGEPQLSVTVVPDSGTGGLEGLAGQMNIVITNGQHAYTFDYTLASASSPQGR